MSAPVERTELGSIALTVAAVPTGMNAGVLISPLAVVILPKRALPSLASKENFMLFSHKDISYYVERSYFTLITASYSSSRDSTAFCNTFFVTSFSVTLAFSKT